MTKLNGKALLEQAEEQGRIYRMKGKWRKMLNVVGVLMCLFIIGIPLGIWFFLVGRSARLGITDQGFAVKWFGTQAYAWDDIVEFKQAPLNLGSGGAGIVGALVGAAASSAVAKRTQGLQGPLQFKVKGKRMWRGIPAHAIENSLEMAQEMERRTGLEILPREQGAAESAGAVAG